MKKNKGGTRKRNLAEDKYIGYLLKSEIPKNCYDCGKKAKIFVITKIEGCSEVAIDGVCLKHVKELWNSTFDKCLNCDRYGTCGLQKLLFKKEMEKCKKVGLEIG